MHPFARFLSVVVCFAFVLTVSDARPRFNHRRRNHNHGHHPRHSESHSRVVFDGIAATSFVESHEPEEPTPTTYYPTQTATTTTDSTGISTTTAVTPKTKTTTIVPDTCENVACQSHGDCTYNGCGGYFCVTCPACDGEEEMGVCLWDPSPDDMECPQLICPSDSIHRNTINVIDTPPQTINITQLDPSYYPQNDTNDTQLEQSAEPPQEPPQQQPAPTTRPASPWDSSFSNLKEESQNNTDPVYVDQTESFYNGTESSEDDLG